MKLLNEKLSDLRRRTSVKWREYPEDVLPMWVAEMDAPVADPVREAITDALDRGDTGYACGDSYAMALADFARDRWGWAIEAERMSLVPDVMLGLVELLKLVTGPGDAIVVNPPVYPPFYLFLEHMDRRVLTAPLAAGRIDFDRLREVFPEAKAYLLCSPHNPTGTVHTEAELAAVAELAAAHQVTVVVDEIHAPLVLPGSTFTPYLSVSDEGFCVMSASKGWNLAALKGAVAIAGASAASVERLARMPEEVKHGVSHMGVIAHTAALRHGRDWLDTLLGELDGNRALLGELLAEHLPEIGYRPPQASYLAWLDCRALGLEKPGEVFLERGRVALNAGETFGQGGQGHVRMNIATSHELITEGVHRMVAAVRQDHL